MSETLDSWLPSVVTFEDPKEMAALLAKTQMFEQRLKIRYLDIKTGASKAETTYKDYTCNICKGTQKI